MDTNRRFPLESIISMDTGEYLTFNRLSKSEVFIKGIHYYGPDLPYEGLSKIVPPGTINVTQFRSYPVYGEKGKVTFLASGDAIIPIPCRS